jgi:hypothetical protein
MRARVFHQASELLRIERTLEVPMEEFPTLQQDVRALQELEQRYEAKV